MRLDIISLLPDALENYFTASIIGRAQKRERIRVVQHDLRRWAIGKHRKVDDTPYGGGAGMVMKVEPIHRTLQAIEEDVQAKSYALKATIVLSARGTAFTQEKALELSKLDHLVLICGRYEGIDQRVADYLADEEISIGPYVLAGGELPALVVAEAAIRLIPGVLGNPESLIDESHTPSTNYLEAPQYTKPEEYNGWSVPDVLLSGHHTEIDTWRKNFL